MISTLPLVASKQFSSHQMINNYNKIGMPHYDKNNKRRRESAPTLKFILDA
jgi:hypothetical protein